MTMYQPQDQSTTINTDLYLYNNMDKEEEEDMDLTEKFKSKSRRGSLMNKAERRAEHNAIERARRECLNSKFQQLAEALPNLQNHRRPSKGQIVEKALDWVKQNMTKEDRYQYQIMQLQNENKRLLCQINIIQDKQKQTTNTGVITPPPQTPLHYYMPQSQPQMNFLLPVHEDDTESHSSNEDISNMQLLYNDISHYQVLQAMDHPFFKQSFYS